MYINDMGYGIHTHERRDRYPEPGETSAKAHIDAIEERLLKFGGRMHSQSPHVELGDYHEFCVAAFAHRFGRTERTYMSSSLNPPRW